MDGMNFCYLPSTEGSCTPADSPTVKADAPCPCCGRITIPNHGDALAYICPVCCWEIDLFIHSENEPSDQNHGLTLKQARWNYQKYGAVLPHLRQYSRAPKEDERPE